jgi:hypothetical protein
MNTTLQRRTNAGADPATDHRLWALSGLLSASVLLAGCDERPPPASRPLPPSARAPDHPGVAPEVPSLPSPQVTPSAANQEVEPSAAFFWFSSRSIVNAGHSDYGTQAYTPVLRQLTPAAQGADSGWFILFDGDALSPASGFYNYLREQDRPLLEEQVALTSDVWYVIAVFGTPSRGWEPIDAGLRQSAAQGYKGMTLPRSPNRDTFLNACRILSLPVAARIDGRRFKKISFATLSDPGLKDLGFDPYK